ncbi:hypothetical protein Sme01_36400 [Sphaerisporangium melleum]|uniref:Uncharacterized protein n=1 Tax=Sphaerisporangium melleum TaxID=321316 RepID=A0A917VTB1_9ACTN|nr:hypothetical protein GCM10007964_67950 [Sphaerisporangium melleum]GII71164.1 hypothetical protein Sme01_36400 [Sphaerisporangium melleum]
MTPMSAVMTMRQRLASWGSGGQGRRDSVDNAAQRWRVSGVIVARWGGLVWCCLWTASGQGPVATRGRGGDGRTADEQRAGGHGLDAAGDGLCGGGVRGEHKFRPGSVAVHAEPGR